MYTDIYQVTSRETMGNSVKNGGLMEGYVSRKLKLPG